MKNGLLQPGVEGLKRLIKRLLVDYAKCGGLD